MNGEVASGSPNISGRRREMDDALAPKKSEAGPSRK